MSSAVYVDLAFPARGRLVPLDHGYSLFSSLSRALPELHAQRDWGVHPILGQRTEAGVLALTPKSHVKLRVPNSVIATVLPLTDQTIEVGGQRIRLEPPRIFPLIPSVSLRARFVTIKGACEPEPFLHSLRRQLANIPDLGQDPERIEVAVGPRRVMRIKDKVVVGFAVALGHLEASASLATQSAGLGGRRRMGAGLFVPPPRRVSLG